MVSELPPSDGSGDAHHERSGAEPLRDLARGALRGALLAGERVNNPEEQVRDLLRKACEVARAHDVHVEQVLILLKESWTEFSESRLVNHRDAQAILARVVTLCIEEYYTPSPQP